MSGFYWSARTGVSLALAGWALSGLASPTGWQATTVWQRAASPEFAARALVLDEADRKREPKDETYDASAIRTQLHRAAATLLDLARVESSDDPDALYLLGECLTYAGPQYLRRAKAVLESALMIAPSHPNAGGAWDNLGRVNLALGHYAAGFLSFERALALVSDRDERESIRIEQGLGALRAGELEAAIERLQFAAADSASQLDWSLASWALAVAMDRAMYGPEAQRLAHSASLGRFGASGNLDVLALDEVELEPNGEEYYYRALAAMGKARAVPPAAQRAAYQEAKFLWLGYLGSVGPTGPWLERVRSHLSVIDAVEQRYQTTEDADLDEQARESGAWETPDAGLAADDPLWPEEIEQGRRFWGLDAGAE